MIRSYEAEADAFGLNASREPYGEATVEMRLSTYRKLRPSSIEEFLFYDHPSGYERVQARSSQSTLNSWIAIEGLRATRLYCCKEKTVLRN